MPNDDEKYFAAVRTAASHLAVAHRTAKGGGGGDPVAVEAALHELNEARLARQIVKALRAAPPLSAAARVRLAAILGGGAR